MLRKKNINPYVLSLTYSNLTKYLQDNTEIKYFKKVWNTSISNPQMCCTIQLSIRLIKTVVIKRTFKDCGLNWFLADNSRGTAPLSNQHTAAQTYLYHRTILRSTGNRVRAIFVIRQMKRVSHLTDLDTQDVLARIPKCRDRLTGDSLIVGGHWLGN